MPNEKEEQNSKTPTKPQKPTREQKKAAKKLTEREKPLKPITMFVVVDNEDPDTPITFTATRKEAIFALDQYIYLKNYKHFRLWCPIHGYEIDHGPAWREYARTVLHQELTDTSRYTLVEVKYDPKVIASLLRSCNRCTPMGCPFDTDEELNEYSTYLAQKSERVERGEDQYSPIEEALDLLFEDIEEQNCADYDAKHGRSNPDAEDNSCPHNGNCDA